MRIAAAVLWSLLLARWAVAATPPAISADVAQRCETCHAEETAQWRASPHARSLNPEFLQEWKSGGRKWECLVCHSSQYDRKTGEYSAEGITCESCHGVLREDHPDETRMVLPVDSRACEPCHSLTYGEWRISAHGQKGIRCFDCHRMHQMEIRKEEPDQLCGTCHPARLKDFAHATHGIKGLHCISCHMPEPAGVRTKIKGTGVRVHTLGVSGVVCSNCHREMVHQSHELASLEEEVERLKAVNPESLSRQVLMLQKETAMLRESVGATRRVFPWILVLAFALGSSFGVAVLRVVRRRRSRSGEAPKDPGKE